VNASYNSSRQYLPNDLTMKIRAKARGIAVVATLVGTSLVANAEVRVADVARRLSFALSPSARFGSALLVSQGQPTVFAHVAFHPIPHGPHSLAVLSLTVGSDPPAFSNRRVFRRPRVENGRKAAVARIRRDGQTNDQRTWWARGANVSRVGST
jgi:hypothetical protein